MKSIAYIYFKTPDLCAVRGFICQLIEVGIVFNKFGKSDPPRLKDPSIDEILNEFHKIKENNKWLFAVDKKNLIDITIQLFFDPRWIHSTISFSGDSTNVESISLKIIKEINPYMAIIGLHGMGKDQKFNILSISNDCPKEIRDTIKSAQQE